jgi:predicted SnoaL-like aldol condensation-catalyzing enzyme
MNNRAKMEESIRTLYSKVFNAGQADLFPGLIAGPYIQHNPLFPNGPEPLMGYLKQTGSVPCEVKRMAIDGNLAFVHVRYLNWGDKEHAGVDIFRFNDEGKIVEHWDVLQAVPETAANSNTMF